MDLKTYFAAFPRGERGARIRQMAESHGVSEVTVRSWIAGRRRHPYLLAAVEITERETGGRVTRHDLWPEVYGEANPEDPGG